MTDKLFTKAEMLDLTGMPATNLPYLTTKGLVATKYPVRRGQRPLYELGEVIKLALMERMRSVDIPYEKSATYIDGIRARAGEERQVDGQTHVYGFWKVLERKIEPDHIVWLTIADNDPHGMWLWRRCTDEPQAAEFALMAASEQLPADGFDSYIILNIGPLVRSITQQAR
jgi:hypothetical protein